MIITVEVGKQQNDIELIQRSPYKKCMLCINNFWDLLFLLVFLNNNLFSDRDLVSSSYCMFILFQ